MVPAKLVGIWENSYRAYGRAVEHIARAGATDRQAAWDYAHSSWSVAAAWRQLAASSELPWWALAAVQSAAQAFEEQARTWDQRAGKGVDPYAGLPVDER